MIVVIDTSVALKWTIDEDASAEALKLLSRALIAPDLMQAELGNVLAKKVRRREISQEQAKLAFDETTVLVTLLPSPTFAAAAFELALRLEHAVYDCYFLAVAEAQGSLLVTADRVFVEKVRKTELAPLISHLGEEIPDV